jgi:hypothetical protein
MAAGRIGAGATLEVAGSDSSTVTFQSSTGALRLDHSATFSGKILNFSGTGTLSGSDQIDLRDVKYSSAHASYANGVLAVADGLGDIGKLAFNGSYTLANFKLASDGAGGTIVYDPPVTHQTSHQAGAISGASLFREALFTGSANLFANYIASALAATGANGAMIHTQPPPNEPPWLASPRHT